MSSDRLFFLKYLAQTSISPLMVEVERAEGSWLYGPGGQRYLDLASGVSVSNTGHANQRVVEAVREQAGRYLHLMVYGEIIQSPQVRYAEKLISILPSPLNTVYFVNSGSEAVEGALKLSRRFTRKTGILSFEKAYHGSTYGALSIQGSDEYSAPFGPLLPGIRRYPLNDKGVIKIIDENTAAVIIEPIQAEAGVIAADQWFLKLLRVRCNETGSLLIFDECQTAFGRTGTLFAFEKYGIIPDILVLAKALGGGMPLGAFIAPQHIMKTLSVNPSLGHITTFGGHPVSCAAGMASLEYLIDNRLIPRTKICEEKFRMMLKHDLIKEIRGEGLLLAVILADSSFTRYVVANAPKHGFISDFFLFCPDAFRIAPPLTITDDEIDEACSMILTLLDEAMKT